MIVLSGGGTGGHLSIIRSLKNELNNIGIKPIFIGSSNGQDRAWFENEDGFEKKYFFNTKGVVNKNIVGKFISLSNILLYSLKCYSIFKKYHIKKVISVGGYSAAAASLGAIFFKKELYIHEQNAIMGTLNKKLAPYAKEIFSSYLPNSPIKGYPVDSKFFEKSRVRKELKTIIFLGGSQGAKAINNLAKTVSRELIQRDISVIHQCGKNEYNELKKFYEQNNLKVELYDFIKDMPSMLNRADLAISRSGASTLWELCANRLPAIFIPYPYAASDHQYHNAKFLMKKNLCHILREEEATEQKILKLIFSIDIKEISSKLQSVTDKETAKKIVNRIL